MTDDIFDQQAMFDAAIARLEKDGRNKVCCAAPPEPKTTQGTPPVKEPPKKEKRAPLKPKPPLCEVEPYVVWTTPDDTVVPVEDLPPDLATFCNLWTHGELRRSFRLKLIGGSWERIGMWLQCVGSDGPEQQLSVPMLEDQLLDCLGWFDEHRLVQNLLAIVELLPGAIARLPLSRKDMTSVVMHNDASGKTPAVFNDQKHIYPPLYIWDAKVIGEPSYFFNHTNWESLFTLVVSSIFDLRADDDAELAIMLRKATETTGQVVGVEHQHSLDVVTLCRNVLWSYSLSTNKIVISSERLATLWPTDQPSTQKFLEESPTVCNCDILYYGPPAFDIFSALEPGSLFLPAVPATLGVRYTKGHPSFHSVDGRNKGDEWVGLYGYQHVATVVANAHAVAGVINPTKIKK